MKNKKTISILFVLATCVILQQNGMAQKTDDENLPDGNQPVALQTQALISSTMLHGDAGGALRDGNQLFLVSFGRPVIGVMKGASDTAENGYWYVAVSGLSKDGIEPETEVTADAVESEVALPDEFALSQNYPNPFNPSTTIEFQIPAVDGLSEVATGLKIFDLRGRLIRTLVDKNMPPGYHSFYWDGLSDAGTKVSSGIYFYTIKAGDFGEKKKMMVIK